MTTVSTTEELNAALLSIAPIITLRGGVYEGGSGTHAFNINRPVSLVAYSGETPILTYNSSSPPQAGGGNIGGIVAIRSNSVILDGITIIGTRDLGSSPANTDVNLVLAEGVSDFTVRNCVFKKAAHANLKTGDRGGFLIVENCTFEDSGFVQTDHHIYISDDGSQIIIRNCDFNTQHGGYAIHLYNPSNSLPSGCSIYGNVIHHNKYGVLLGGNNHDLFNNTICDNTLIGLQLWKGDSDLDIRNNIIMNNGQYDLSPDTVSVLEAHNFEDNNIDSIRVLEWSGAREMNIDPEFISLSPEEWEDYALSESSPMRNAANSISGVSLIKPDTSTLQSTENGTDNIGAFGD